MPVIETRNLTYTYSPGTPFEKTAMKDVSLSVERGDFIGVIGHTGSGKSTLLRCATMLETMDGGDLIYLGDYAAKADAQGKAVYAAKETL